MCDQLSFGTSWRKEVLINVNILHTSTVSMDLRRLYSHSLILVLLYRPGSALLKTTVDMYLLMGDDFYR